MLSCLNVPHQVKQVVKRESVEVPAIILKKELPDKLRDKKLVKELEIKRFNIKHMLQYGNFSLKLRSAHKFSKTSNTKPTAC